LSRTLIANGLATVDTDVELDLFVLHPDATQLRITLTNPAGAEVTVFDGEASEVFLRRHPVIGFSGDEMVNGPWTLRIIDTVSGEEGTLDHWTLRLGSRFD
jgi:subtilisin-like proprotein convertase family protein